MCEIGDGKFGITVHPKAAEGHSSSLTSTNIEDLLPIARSLAAWPETRTSHVGFIA